MADYEFDFDEILADNETPSQTTEIKVEEQMQEVTDDGENKVNEPVTEEPEKEEVSADKEVSDDGKVEEPEAEKETAESKETDWEKRFKDTQATYQKEHQKLLELEKKLEELENKKELTPEESKLLNDDKVKELIEKTRQETAQLNWEKFENFFKDGKDDYDTVVYEVFEPEVRRNPALMEEFKAAGGTPKAAYELGQKVKLQQEILSDPAGYKNKLMQEVMEMLKKEGATGNKVNATAEDSEVKQEKVQTLSDINSQASTNTVKNEDYTLDNVLAGAGI